jgi:uncharacterized protein
MPYRSPVRDAVLMVVLSCLFSWSLWVPIIASQRGWIAATIPVMPWGSFGPALAALALACLSKGGLRELASGLGKWRVGAIWYVVAIVAPMIAQAIAIVAGSGVGRSVPEWQHLDKLYLAVPLFLLVLVVGGPLGEEVGWRGYALPRLLARTGPLPASLVLAAAWVLWHLPLFWLEGAAQAGGSIPQFALLVLCSAVLFTWLYIRTGGSVLLAILFHAGINFATWGSTLILPASADDPVVSMVLLVVAAIAAAVIVSGWVREPKRPPGGEGGLGSDVSGR